MTLLPAHPTDRVATAVLLFSATLWGLTWMPLKGFIAQGLPGPLVSLLTYGSVGVLALFVLWRDRAAWRAQWGLVLALTLVGGWANTSFVNAVMLGDVARVMFLFYLSPVWSVLGGWLFLKERIPPARWAAVAGAIVGLWLVLGGPGLGSSEALAFTWVDALSLSAGFAFAANNVIARAAHRVPLRTKTFAVFVGCGLLSAIATALSGRELPVIGAWLWVALLAYGFGWMLLATVTWQYGVSHLESSRAGVILLAELLVSVGTAIAVGGESLSPMGWAGGALITVAALAEALLPPADPARAPTPSTATVHRHRPHAMNTTVWMNQLSWVDYQQRIHTDQPPVLLPVGALEQHGPHLPLGTDGLLASAVAADTAARVGGLVAPTLSYGYKSQPKCGGGQHFCGTTSVDAATLIGQIRDAVREFARHGVDKLVVVNGHYENQWFLIEGIDLGLRDAKAADPTCALQVMRLEYWDFMTPETLGHVFPDGFPGFALEHAAVLETSMMLHHHPSLVRMDLLPDDGPADFPPYDLYPPRTDWVPPSGVLSSAKGADAVKGQLLADEVSRRMAEAITTGFTRP